MKDSTALRKEIKAINFDKRIGYSASIGDSRPEGIIDFENNLTTFINFCYDNVIIRLEFFESDLVRMGKIIFVYEKLN